MAHQATNDTTPTLSGTVSDNDPSSGIQKIVVVIATQTLTVTPDVLTPVPGQPGTWSWSVDVPTAITKDGAYDVRATAYDNAGNFATDTSTNELILDTKSPTVTVQTLSTVNNLPYLTGTVTDPDPSSLLSKVVVALSGTPLANLQASFVLDSTTDPLHPTLWDWSLQITGSMLTPYGLTGVA